MDTPLLFQRSALEPGSGECTSSGLEFLTIADAVICKSTLPDWKVRSQPMRKTSFDEPHDTLDSDVEGSRQDEHDPA
jgi:hypothetical protein